MPVSELLYEGMILMFLGMGIVFSFLAILVLAMKAMSGLSQRLDNAEPDTSPDSL
jgi:oxaloacetate decarboxylase gamma subunit